MQAPEKKYVTHSIKKHSILALGIFTLIYAMFMPDFDTCIVDYITILKSQAYLVHDYTETAGISASFINVAIHFFIAYYLIVRNNYSDFRGLQMAAVGIYTGYAFFGSNPLNTIPIIVGVSLFAIWSGHNVKLYTAVSMFSCAMAPVVSFIMFKTDMGIWSVILAILTGIFIGFIAPPLAEEFLKFHQGFSLYNMGFTTGIVVMFISILFDYINVDIKVAYYYSTHAHYYLLIYILILSFVFIAISMLKYKKVFRVYKELIKSSGRLPSDFSIEYGLSTTLFNMGINTLIFTGIILISGFKLNGTLLGGLMTITGFSALGKHPRGCLPVAFGVIIAGLMHGLPFANQRLLLTMLFSTGLSPVAGYYGIIAGIVAGFLHYNLTVVILKLHLGMTLYNNGFTTVFVAAFLVPIIDTFFRTTDRLFVSR